MNKDFGPWGLELGTRKTFKIEKDYLWDYFLSIRRVLRFSDSDKYDSVFVEDDMAHILRLMQRVVDLPKTSFLDVKKMLRTMYIHDLVETGRVFDVSAVDKALNKKLDNETKSSETEIAKKMFNKIDFKLYLEFEQAGEFWKGREKEMPLSKEALVSQLLDKVDGNMAFHYRMRLGFGTKRLKSPYHLDAFRHMFTQYELFAKRFADISEVKFINFCKQILMDQFEYLAYLWGDIPTEEVPEILNEGLVNRLGINWKKQYTNYQA